MARLFHILIVTFILTSYSSISLAKNPIDYLSLQIGENSISIDSFGATSIKDTSLSYKLFAVTNINNNLMVEYGFMNLGVYKANYDISVGTFQFIEKHKVDFSKSLFTSIKLGSIIPYRYSDYKTDYPPNDKFYFYLRLGAVLWQADLEMDGYMYDSGSPYGPYGATSHDRGLSTFYGIGAEYKFTKYFIFSLNWELYSKVGDGATLKYIDGTTKKYSGRNVESIGLGVTYIF